MNYLLAIFRNKTETMAFYSILLSYKIQCRIINTPKQALIACGISVKLAIENANIALEIMKRRKFDNFVGFYKVYDDGKSYSIMPFHSF